MAFQSFTVKIIGTAPLMLHNGQLADPLNEFAKQLKAVSGKKKKTDDDYAEMSRIEWHGGIYQDEDGYAIIPSESIEATLIEGAKKSKLGKMFKSAVFINDNARIIFPKLKKAAELWNDKRFVDKRAVRVGTSRVIRTRPIFNEWSAEIAINYDSEQVNHSEVMQALRDAGLNCGVGTFRPKFGRFKIEG